MSEIDVKTERICRLLTELDLDGVLLNGQHNFAWISGGGSNGVDSSRDNGVASILITRNGRRCIVTNNIEIGRMTEEELPGGIFEPIEYAWQLEKADPLVPLGLARAIAGERIATDIALFPGVSAVDGKLSSVRSILTEEEIERSRAIGRDASIAFDEIASTIKPGQTENEIAMRVRSSLAAKAITSVVTLVAADERIAAYRHPVPTDNVFRKLALLVTCARRHGLILSLSRLVCIGSVHEELDRRTRANASVFAAMLHATRPGATGKDVYEAARSAYSESGFPGEIDRHHQGGAAGYRTREWVAHPESKEVVHANQLFAWNPSITGTKVEETVLTVNGTPETLTSSAQWPTISNIIDGIEYHSPGIRVI